MCQKQSWHQGRWTYNSASVLRSGFFDSFSFAPASDCISISISIRLHQILMHHLGVINKWRASRLTWASRSVPGGNSAGTPSCPPWWPGPQASRQWGPAPAPDSPCSAAPLACPASQQTSAATQQTHSQTHKGMSHLLRKCMLILLWQGINVRKHSLFPGVMQVHSLTTSG